MLQGSSLTRLAYVALTCAAAFIGWTSVPAQADNYPTRPITVIVPSPPGGGTDTQARILAPKLGEILGQTVVIENRGGASGNIGAQAVSKAAPDGYTLLAMISSHVINQFVLKSVPYNLDKDFAMISRTVTVPGVLVGNPSLPAKDLKELLAYLKANPGKVAFGSAGIGSLSHLIVELFEQDAGVKLLHVPYRGTQPALQRTSVGGQVVARCARSHHRARARSRPASCAPTASPAPPLAGRTRHSDARRGGLAGFNAVQWFGLSAPAGTPRPIVDKLHAAVTKALNDPEVKKRYESSR